MIVTALSGPRRGAAHATMRDVARIAGVSLKTVSRVVNGGPGVHAATVRRVRDAIDEVGFRRHPGPRGAPAGAIAVVTEDLANPFSASLIGAVQEVAGRRDRQVLAGSSNGDPDRERELVLEFCARRVDGLLVVPAGGRHGYLVPEIRAGAAMVFVDRPPGDIAMDTVLLDNAGGTARAVGHLARHGHRRIAYLGDAPRIFTAAERLRGFRSGCAGSGLRFDGGLVAMGPHDRRSIAAALRRVLRRPTPATAVVTGNNRITVLVLQALAGWRDRPALVGFDDFELADLLEPKVSVIAHDVAALGRAATDLLLARLDGEDSPPHQVTLPGQQGGELRRRAVPAPRAVQPEPVEGLAAPLRRGQPVPLPRRREPARRDELLRLPGQCLEAVQVDHLGRPAGQLVAGTVARAGHIHAGRAETPAQPGRHHREQAAVAGFVVGPDRADQEVRVDRPARGDQHGEELRLPAADGDGCTADHNFVPAEKADLDIGHDRPP
jgi:LacI family transcriptional regulator, galactose operon repressor